MEFFNLTSKVRVPSLDAAEVAAWEASNPIDKDLIFASDEGNFYYYDEASGLAVALLALGGMQVYTKYVRNYSGTTYVNSDLEDAEILLLLMDGFPRYQVASGPDAGSEFSFDDTTGTIDIGTDFDENDLVIQYKSLTPPASP